MELKNVYIVDGVRTPFLKAKGGVGPFSASDLAFNAGRALLLRQNFSPDDLDEVILGCVMPDADEANIGRVVSLRLGCGKQTPAWTVQRNCASGMQSIDSAFKDIQTGRASLVMAGGTEAMSRASLLFSHEMVNWLASWYKAKSFGAKLRAIRKFKLSQLKPVIGLLKGLTDPVVGLSMGQTAEILAHKFNISRTEMDQFAIDSHEKLANAIDNNIFKNEIETLYDSLGNFYEYDNGLRRDSTIEKLAKLRPVFDRDFGNVTAGNSAQVTDGSAMLILADEEAVKKHNLKPIAKIIDIKWAGLDPSQMGLGPVHAISEILKANNLKLSDIDLFEINEAFSTQVIGCLKALNDKDYCEQELGLDEPIGELPLNKLNINGGAVSMGHPVGASGARISLHMANILQEKNKKLGIASLCIGGGQGGAVLLEKV